MAMNVIYWSWKKDLCILEKHNPSVIMTLLGSFVDVETKKLFRLKCYGGSLCNLSQILSWVFTFLSLWVQVLQPWLLTNCRIIWDFGSDLYYFGILLMKNCFIYYSGNWWSLKGRISLQSLYAWSAWCVMKFATPFCSISSVCLCASVVKLH